MVDVEGIGIRIEDISFFVDFFLIGQFLWFGLSPSFPKRLDESRKVADRGKSQIEWMWKGRGNW
jgi:hypothetical protein